MLKKYFTAIFIIIALFILIKTSQSQTADFGIYYHIPHYMIYSPIYHPHPYYYPGYMYYNPPLQRYYYPKRHFYKQRFYRHDNGYHRGWYKRHRWH